MAYDSSWLSPNKVSGNGNDTVTFSALSDNTGRNSRTTNVTFSAVDCTDVVRAVAQGGKPEFGDFDSSTAAASSSGQTLTLSGKSNSSKLTFSKGTDNIGLTVPSSYTANGTTTNNGSAITGDPGATSQYAWSIQFTVPANTTISAKTCQIVVTDDAGHTNTCTITLAAGAATLSVGSVSGDLAWNAYTQSSTVSVSVTSNTNWTVS